MTSTARRHLDERFTQLKNIPVWTRPTSGWIRAIRDSLGMTTRQLAKRLNLSQARVVAMEKDEVKGGLKLETLERVADALDCILVYALVPKDSLQSMVQNQALTKAKEVLVNTRHTMSLEDQLPGEADQRAMLDKIVNDLLQGSESRLWD